MSVAEFSIKRPVTAVMFFISLFVIGLIAAARAWALLDGRDHVLPDDVHTLFPHVAAHRLHLAGDGRPAPPATLVRLMQAVAVR